ncbi:MAG: hypothetical protein GEU26_03135 [Nitrososphaeraceae archaeon]|nr:hypothetical protein [Nitrososphaeraceae archaeon]
MLAQGYNETDIAHLLGVHVSTISRDIKVLKQLSQRFVFDLAKGDLVYFYKRCIDEVEEVRRAAWTIINNKKQPDSQLFSFTSKPLWRCSVVRVNLNSELHQWIWRIS